MTFRRKKYLFYVYILSSFRWSLYIGVTNNLLRRIVIHKRKINQKSFSKKYNCHRLVYYEEYENIVSAIEREKQIKRWRREKKVNLINRFNPNWYDLYYFKGDDRKPKRGK